MARRSDALEIGCDHGEKVRVAFAFDRCDGKTMRHVAITSGVPAENLRDLMVARPSSAASDPRTPSPSR